MDTAKTGIITIGNQPNITEFVCTLNSGRSPLAKIFADTYISDESLENIFKAISSGSHADDIKAGNFNLAVAERFVGIAIKRGDIYNAWNVDEIKAILKNGDLEEIRPFYEMAAGYRITKPIAVLPGTQKSEGNKQGRFLKEEHKFRADYLEANSLVDKFDVKSTEQQTIIQPNAVAILTMGESNKNAVQKIYEKSIHNPIIDTLGGFIGANKDIADTFGGTQEEYINCIAQVKEYSPLAIEKLNEMVQ